MTDQRADVCPDCGARRTELVVAPGRFYCPACGIAGPGPNADTRDGVQLELDLPARGDGWEPRGPFGGVPHPSS